MNTRIRIYELSKELILENREILNISEHLGIEAKSFSSTVSEEEAQAIRNAALEWSVRSSSPNLGPPQVSIPKPPTPNLEPSQVSIPKPPTPNLEPPQVVIPTPSESTVSRANRSSSLQTQTVQRIRRRAKGYIEPRLDVGTAIPLHMVLIPAGTFTMGSPENEPERERYESPQHEVTLQPFFMGRYPVTQAQWRAVAALPQQQQELDPDPSIFKVEDRPVESVSWYEAIEFCARLSVYTNRDYRLPTEAEWEYSCRAGTRTPFYFGNTLTDELANYDARSTYSSGVKGHFRQETTDINHFGIGNAFGLSEMHGNVLEWCQDHWHENYKGSPFDGSAWLSNNEASRRILRGGSWYFKPRNCRSAYRNSINPDTRFNYIGFRVSCSSPRSLP